MSVKSKIGRRAVLAGLTATTSSITMVDYPADLFDGQLLALGREMEAIPALLNETADHDAAVALLDRLEKLSNQIASFPARTIRGVQVKARATAWALENDFDPMKETTLNNRMIASLVKDLLKIGSMA